MIGAVSSDSVGSLNIPGLGSRFNNPSFWVQDDYKVTNKLTLNLGLRWDIFPSIQEAHNIFSFLNPNGSNSVTGSKGTLMFAGNGDPSLYCNCKSPSSTYFGNVGPRIGMAYSVNSKTVIRGSYTVNFARGDWTSEHGSKRITEFDGFRPVGIESDYHYSFFPADLLGWHGLLERNQRGSQLRLQWIDSTALRCHTGRGHQPGRVWDGQLRHNGRGKDHEQLQRFEPNLV